MRDLISSLTGERAELVELVTIQGADIDAARRELALTISSTENAGTYQDTVAHELRTLIDYARPATEKKLRELLAVILAAGVETFNAIDQLKRAERLLAQAPAGNSGNNRESGVSIRA